MRYSFGGYVLDTERRELHHAGQPIKLRRKMFQVLVYLLAHCDRVVPKQELLEHLWPDQFVGEETLTSYVKTLRQALGERGRTPRFLRTLHGQGYRFVAAVEVGKHRPADEAPPALPLSRGAGATRQAERPPPALSPPLTDLGSPPWLTKGGFFRHDTDPGACLPLPEGERTKYLPQNSPLREALTLAEALGMRPLQVHCHRSLGTLYAKAARQEQAHAALAMAIVLYRAMAMTFWLPQAEAALTQVGSSLALPTHPKRGWSSG